MLAHRAAAIVPAHVGIIPDGNRRWARRIGVDKRASYRLGAQKALDAIGWCRAAGVVHVSAFGVSQENIAMRPEDEVRGLHAALLFFCDEIRHTPGVALHVFGEPERLPASLPERDALCAVSSTPSDPGALIVHVGINYSARAELAAVARGLRAGDDAESCLLSAGIPPVDLVIRAGGQRRLSGFLPFQTAYAELWFTDTLWSDLGRDEFLSALAWYAEQERRLGE